MCHMQIPSTHRALSTNMSDSGCIIESVGLKKGCVISANVIQ